MRRLLALLAVLVLAPAAAASARDSLVEVRLGGGARSAAALERAGFDVVHGTTRTRARIILSSGAERRALRRTGLRARVVVADLAVYAARSRRIDAGRARAAAVSQLPSGRDSYRYLPDYQAELDALAAAHPGHVRRIDLPGRSVQGRALAGVEIARDVQRTDDGRPVSVVVGVHHAREWPSGEVSMEFATDLARGFGADPRITTLLGNVRVLVVPVVNPDGFVASRGTSPAATGPDPLQRKNAAEVDLNRNYGASWGGNGASTDPADDTYRGPAPWSEPESRAVHELSQRLHITNFQSIHNIGALVLRPPGFRAFGLAPDELRLKALGDRMGAVTGYTSQYGSELYEVTGATEDWNYVAQNAFGYTIELGPPDMPGFFQGPYQTHVVQQYLGSDLSPGGGDGVREALLLAGEQAGDTRDHAVLTGSAPPGATLRLRRSFETITSPICQDPYDGVAPECPQRGGAFGIEDGLDTTLTVPASGAYTWHVTPSTRPFERKAGRTEAWTMSCAVDGQVVAERQVVVGIGERAAVDPCVPLSPAEQLATGAGVPAPAATPATTARRASYRFVVASRQRRSTVLRRGVLVRTTCARACDLRTTLQRPGTARRSAARAARSLGSRRLALEAGRPRSFRVRLSRAARRDVRRGRLRRVNVRLDARSAAGRRLDARGVQLVR